MTFLQKLFGIREKVAPSSSIPEASAYRAIVELSKSFEKDGYPVIPAAVQNTNSMIPTYGDNAILLIHVCGLSDCAAGDILIRESPIGRICHRATRRFGENWECKGDNNPSPDADLVTKDNFRGRVCGIVYAKKKEANS